MLCQRRVFTAAPQDRLIKETADRKNELESYVYEPARVDSFAALCVDSFAAVCAPAQPRHCRYAMRDKIGEGAELGPFISSEDRATFGKMLEEIEEWLYSEEADEGTKVAYMRCAVCCPGVILRR